jgi:leucyl aminopeptidase
VKLSVRAASVTELAGQVIAVPVYASPRGPRPGPGVVELGLLEVIDRSRFTGAPDEELLVAGRVGDPFHAALLVGVGQREEIVLDTLRQAMHRVVRRLGRFNSIATTLPQVLSSTTAGADEAAAVAEGALLGSYSYGSMRSRPPEPQKIEQLTLVLDPGADLGPAQRAVEAAEIVCSSVVWARGLVDMPAGELTPLGLAEEAVRMGERSGLEIRVHDAAALRDGGFGGILAVGAGSANPPCLIEARHHGTDGRVVGLAGKGITFDSGGLLLKNKDAMADMRTDMAGAATMLATAQAAARLGCPTGVLAVVPAAENMPSGHAYRPGDVIRHRGGITSEVIDTDAEGRIVLADALAYLAEQAPDAIIDAATLTYDVIRALGDQISGILGTDRALVDGLIAAGSAVSEPLWELPLWAGYRRNIDSPVADLRNEGGPYADAIHAGLFLAEFTKSVPWAHLDIAGTAYFEHANGGRPAGATGTGVRTLTRWLMGTGETAAGIE